MSGAYYDHFDPFEPAETDEDEEDDAGDDFDFEGVIDGLSEVWEAEEADVLQGAAQRVGVPDLPQGMGEGAELSPAREVRPGERTEATGTPRPVGGDKGRTSGTGGTRESTEGSRGTGGTVFL